jgi:hypothetical protein
MDAERQTVQLKLKHMAANHLQAVTAAAAAWTPSSIRQCMRQHSSRCALVVCQLVLPYVGSWQCICQAAYSPPQ